MPNHRVVLAGGSGFLGQALAVHLLANRFDVTILTRSPQATGLVGTVVPWDGRSVGPWTETLEGARAVVNLAGRSINSRPTPENREEIVRSRVESVQAVTEAIRHCKTPPECYVQVSATGIYGDAGDRICDENTLPEPPNGTVPFSQAGQPMPCVPTWWCPRKLGQSPGTGFIADVCRQWEAAFNDSPTPGIRRVLLRLGVILGRRGGALPMLMALTRLFLGGTAGSGRQYVSWLHLADLNAIFLESITQPERTGVYVATAPEPVTNAELMRQLRQVLDRPWSPPAPALAVRLGAWLLGTDPELILTSQRCMPRRLLQEGFAFQFGQLRPALEDLAR